jgi:ribosomal protein S18 acetylase RimI-like enzyme
MRIEKHDHDCENERLWGKIGCHLVTPAVHKILGGYVVSTQDCTWWVALTDDDKTAGFCMARRHKNGKVVLTYAYVLPEYRDNGLYSRLFEDRLADVLSWPGVTVLEAAVNTNSAPMFLGHGFVETGCWGEFLVMQRRVK